MPVPSSKDGVEHVCGEDCGEYHCSRCDRQIPNCVGALDEYLDYCDDCACELWQVDSYLATIGAEP